MYLEICGNSKSILWTLKLQHYYNMHKDLLQVLYTIGSQQLVGEKHFLVITGSQNLLSVGMNAKWFYLLLYSIALRTLSLSPWFTLYCHTQSTIQVSSACAAHLLKTCFNNSRIPGAFTSLMIDLFILLPHYSTSVIHWTVG